MADWSDLQNVEIDTLKEIGNIGAGNAITAMSKMLGRMIKLRVPAVNMVDFKDIARFLGGPEQIIIGVLVQITGDINGMMMFLVKRESGEILIRSLMGDFAPKKESGDFTELELSAMKEIGNILASSYLGSLSGFIQKNVMPSVPLLSIDMANAILSVPAIEFGKTADHALLIESVFETDTDDLAGYFLLIPDVPSLRLILTALGVRRDAR
ncbi:MAG: chemotaxis protein CheC [Clostridiales bacterium]|jgi:chemotaxis protein CheC|nr:chemotaxis protein CheC [Clostridiales bacterium]